MIDKAVAIIEDFMKHNPEADEEQMIDIDRFHSVVFWLDSEGEFIKVDAEPPYFEGEVTVYPRFAYLMRFDSYGVLQEQIDIKNKITPHIERV